jgi:hypothetical protein
MSILAVLAEGRKRDLKPISTKEPKALVSFCNLSIRLGMNKVNKVFKLN